MKTYSIRLFPDNDQINQLKYLSDIRTDIWNTLLDIQQKEYKDNKRIYSKFDLINFLPNIKKTTKPEWKKLNSKAIQTIAVELFGSYRSFFNLIKKDKTSKPPNKKEINYFHTLVFNQSGWFFKDNKIIINQIPLYYKTHLTNIEKLNIKEIRIKYRNNKWLCDVVIEDKKEFKDDLNIKTRVLAIDLGISKLGTGIDNKGEIIILNNRSKKINKYFSKQINKVKSKLSKKQKGSNNFYKLNKVKKKLYNIKNSQIKQALHIQTKKLSNMNYNTIIVGNLTVKKLMSVKDINKNKKGLRRSFNESNINMFLSFLKYKLQHKQSNLIKINEHNTTQVNCLTGKKFKEKVELNQRTVKLNNDIVIGRDLNSAINILKRYYDNHLASMNEPFEINSGVIEKLRFSRNHIL